MAAQASHASIKVFLDAGKMVETPEGSHWDIPLCPQWKEWLDGTFTKVVVGVNSEAELLEIHRKAKEAGIPTALITDNGLTEFHGVKTNTVVSVGPWDEAAINAVTGHLSLL